LVFWRWRHYCLLDIGKDQSSTIVTIGKVIFNPIDDLGTKILKGTGWLDGITQGRLWDTI
jgi:hypothetical protein